MLATTPSGHNIYPILIILFTILEALDVEAYPSALIIEAFLIPIIRAQDNKNYRNWPSGVGVCWEISCRTKYMW